MYRHTLLGITLSTVLLISSHAYAGSLDAAFDGPVLSLSEGTPDGGTIDSAKAVASEKISDREAARLLRRLEVLETEDGDVRSFALRKSSRPAPRKGATVRAAFPPAATTPRPDIASSETGSLSVLRHAPEGEVPIAGRVSITFSQPMVPVSGHSDTLAGGVPARLEPQPPGMWRWVGTRTLLFDPDPRLPAATDFRVTVPAGTRSELGGELEKDIVWTFSTPAPVVRDTWPESYDPQPLSPIMVVYFDQAVDAASVLPTVKLTAGGEARDLRLATVDEISQEPGVSGLTAAMLEGRWVAFRVRRPLPSDSAIQISIGPGTPSAEGPKTTTEAQGFAFRTYGALELTSARCGWGEVCRPMQPWSLEFSNSLDEDSFDPAWVKISPELAGKVIEVRGNSLHIRGRSAPRTKYEVRVDRALKDVFGQTMSKDAVAPFAVGPAQPFVHVPGDTLVTLDPAGPARLSVFSVGHAKVHVKAYRVSPSHWKAFREYRREADRDDSNRTPPGKLVMDEKVKVSGDIDDLVETSVDLSKAFADDKGHLVVLVNSHQGLLKRFFSGSSTRYATLWVQRTKLGLDAEVDGDGMLAWVTGLADGRAVSGASVGFIDERRRVPSDAGGVASLPMTESHRSGGTLLIAAKDGDMAILPPSTSYWGSSQWHGGRSDDRLAWYVFDDRGMYRPSETVHVKGWIRHIGRSKKGDVDLADGLSKRVDYELSDSRGNEITKGQARINALGGFDFELSLPDDMNLGHARLRLEVEAGDVDAESFHHSFQVQEFRRPEFEVLASLNEGLHVAGGYATATVQAKYYAGGGLAGAPANWRVVSTPTSYQPPGRDDYVFGRWIPWWRRGGGDSSGVHSESFQGSTGVDGAHHLRIDFHAAASLRPSAVTATATVEDVNRQAWTSSASLLVHPATVYVGLRSERSFVERGVPIEVDLIACGIDGKLASDRLVSVEAERLAWVTRKGRWVEEAQEKQSCTWHSGDEPGSCRFETPEGGRYRLRATVKDAEGRGNESELTVWVSGGKRPPSRKVELESVDLIPDKERYQPGDTAELLVQAPFAPASGVMSIRRDGLLHTESFRMEGTSYTLRVPVSDTHYPNLHVQVELVGASPRIGAEGEIDEELPAKPAYATGEINLPVPPLARTLIVEAAPRSREVEPGAKTEVDVRVRDAAGNPVRGAEVAVVVVDEAVLALSGYALADPVATFHPNRPEGVRDYRGRRYVLLSSLVDLSSVVEQAADKAMDATGVGATAGARRRVMKMARPMAAPLTDESEQTLEADSRGSDDQAIAIRKDFRALASFSPTVHTAKDGRARVKVKVPDSLTRYRVMAVAVAGGKHYGKGEDSLTARLPLMVRPSAPRFLNFGDHCELPVVLQNQTDEALTVRVAMRASNVTLSDGAGRRVTVPAKDRVEVRFPVDAVKPGTARFQVAATAGRWSDAASFSLPVWTPATTEAFATYGVIDEGAVAQPVRAPKDAVTAFGGLEITTSSTALQALTDALVYLFRYPFDCSEQIASRLLGLAGLVDVLTAFEADGLPSDTERAAVVEKDLAALQGRQRRDGGFGLWRRDGHDWPYASIHVTHALVRVKKEKLGEVPSRMWSAAQRYLRNIESHIPHWYGERARRSLIAYALYVRELMGDADSARAAALVQEAGVVDLPIEALGWLLPTLHGAKDSARVEAILRHLGNRVTETASTAQFTTSYGDGAHLLFHSSRRVDAILLEALIRVDQKNDVIPKLVEGLLGHRKKGRWTNTQENVFVLLALDRYFETYEKTTPDFVAKAWLGDGFVGQHAFRGRTTERHRIDVPMSWLAAKGPQDLLLQKDGAGRLYYRIGMRYAPSSLQLAAADHGFTVQRKYEAVDDASDVRKGADGTWHVKAGARVRVRLTMVAPERRYHVALVDPIPAGFEAMNPALAVTGPIPQDPEETSSRGGWWWWARTWYEHQNLRDERTEAFASILWEGVHDYSYVARATTPGSYVVPPAKAEEMYHPETFGRSATAKVVVEP